MAISPLQIAPLLGVNGNNLQGFGASSVADIITGSSSDVSLSLLPLSGNFQSQERNSNLDSLEDFIKKNITGANAEKLLSSVEALRTFLKNGSGGKDSSLDPVLSLLSGSSVSAGLIVDELA